jgi:hypothetical protein
LFQILQSAVNHWVGTVRMSSRRYFGQEVARPVGGQSLGFRGEFCAGDRPWSRPKCRRFGAVGLSQSRSIGARRRAAKRQPRPFSFFLWKGKFWGDKITLYHFPELAAGAASFQHQDPRRAKNWSCFFYQTSQRRILWRGKVVCSPQRPLPSSK